MLVLKRPTYPLTVYLCQLVLLIWFLREELTWPTIIVGVATVIVRLFSLKLHRWVPQVVGALLFAHAGLKYGRFISPEMGVNILFSVVCLKLTEAKVERDWRMLTLGLFLLWSSGALFVKTPLYFAVALTGVFFSLSALLKIIGEEVSVSWRQMLRWVVISLPVTVVLFLLLPRFQANVWTPPSPPPVGQIGFSEETRPGEVESLTSTGALAFHVRLNRTSRMGDLYWRGMTLTSNDGWNWSAAPVDETWVMLNPGASVPAAHWIRQSIIHSKPVSRPFALATGVLLESAGRTADAGSNGTWRFGGFQQVRSYETFSDQTPGLEPLPSGQTKSYTLGISLKRLPEFQFLKGLSSEAAILAIKQYFQKNGFTYTLAPGKIPNLAEFTKKKMGWCAHYASATGLLLRAAGHPTRLVSGYLGGTYNRQSGHWTVSEDDAHVWVETWDGTKWQAVDPTLWIAPSRGELSGSEFVGQLTKQSSLFSPTNLPQWFRDTQMWVESMNYRFLVWSEELDLEKQRSWARALDWDLSTLYIAGLWILGLALGGWWLREWWRTRPRAKDLGARLLVWRKWRAWWRKRGHDLALHWGPERWREETHVLKASDQSFAREWIDDWEKGLYQQNETAQTLQELSRRLSR